VTEQIMEQRFAWNVCGRRFDGLSH